MSKNTLTPQAIDSEKLQKLYDGSFPDVYLLVLYIWATTRENLSSWFAKYKVIVYQFKGTAGDSLASHLHQLTNRLDAIASNQQAHMHRPPKSNTRGDFFGMQESHKREYNSKLPSRDIRSANELDGDMLEAMSSDIKTILESVKETSEIVNTIRKDQMAVILKESGKENVEESSTTTKTPETTTTLEPEHQNNVNCKIIRPQSCLELLNAGCNQSGVYSVYPTKGEKDLVEVYCDQETDGGGWIAFLRRQDGSVDFYKRWEMYMEGFGDLEGEFWLGLDNVHNLLSTNLHYELRVDLENFDQHKVHASYNNFSVGSEAENYVLTAEGYSGDAEDGLYGHSGEAFSTFDRDNDKEGTSCARFYHGAWWYRHCFRSNLCGRYYDPAEGHGPYYLNYFKWKYTSFMIKFAEMKFRQLRGNV